MVSLRFSTIVAALLMLWLGGAGISTALANRERVTIKAADYAKAKPDAKWLELTDCFLSLLEGTARQRDGRLREVLVPIRALGDDGTGRVHVVLASHEDRLLALVQQLLEARSTEARVKLVNDVNGKGPAQHTVRGLVRQGVALDSEERQEMESLSESLTPDFVILDHDEQPSLLGGVLAVATGTGIIVFHLIRSLRSRASASPTA